MMDVVWDNLHVRKLSPLISKALVVSDEDDIDLLPLSECELNFWQTKTPRKLPNDPELASSRTLQSGTTTVENWGSCPAQGLSLERTKFPKSVK